MVGCASQRGYGRCCFILSGPYPRFTLPAAPTRTLCAVQIVHPSREAEQLRSQLLGLIRNALQPLLRDRVG